MSQQITCPDCWDSNVYLNQTQSTYICKHCHEKFDADKYEPCEECGKLHQKSEGCICENCYDYISSKQ